ncbi:MAG: hypothetical protein ABI718_05225 [Acidobacteriota bacterium]
MYFPLRFGMWSAGHPEGAERPKDLVNENRAFSALGTGKVEKIRRFLSDDTGVVVSFSGHACAPFPRAG